MRITESKLRRVIRSVILESAVSEPQLGKGYGVVVYGHSITFDSFVLKIVLDKEFNIRYAKEAIDMQEGSIVENIGNTTLLAEFKNNTKSGKHQTPGLVAENIAFYIGRG
tara:strand:- start:94 stop:423 length:330 start_codon:yes stop_codon:yes gene_type:complete